MHMADVILEVKDLKIFYPVKAGIMNKTVNHVRAVDGVSFSVYSGESFGLVGESGCGKSTLGNAIVGLLKPVSGEIRYKDKVISSKEYRRTKEDAREIQIIFQDPYSSLDPRFTVGRSIEEPLRIQKSGNSQERKKRALEIMSEVGLNQDHYTKFPHEFSGGQRQRIGIARALVLEPDLLVCDEPVSALDVSIQAQILNMMQDLQDKFNLTYIFISHDLSVVEHLCDRVAVMYLGTIVELAHRDDLFTKPMHPYTQALLRAVPVPDPTVEMTEEVLEGDVPSPVDPPPGCRFHTRCPYAQEICMTDNPAFAEEKPNHFVSCHFTREIQEELKKTK